MSKKIYVWPEPPDEDGLTTWAQSPPLGGATCSSFGAELVAASPCFELHAAIATTAAVKAGVRRKPRRAMRASCRSRSMSLMGSVRLQLLRQQVASWRGDEHRRRRAYATIEHIDASRTIGGSAKRTL